MKFLGHDTVGCQCHYCIGPNGSKPARRAIKKRGRQQAKREIEAEVINRPDKKRGDPPEEN